MKMIGNPADMVFDEEKFMEAYISYRLADKFRINSKSDEYILDIKTVTKMRWKIYCIK